MILKTVEDNSLTLEHLSQEKGQCEDCPDSK